MNTPTLATGTCPTCGSRLTEVETGNEEYTLACPLCALTKND